MTRADLTEKILDIKREKGWSWKYIHQQVGGYSPVLLVGALLGQMKLTRPQAAKAADLFGLSKAETALLNEVPMRRGKMQSRSDFRGDHAPVFLLLFTGAGQLSSAPGAKILPFTQNVT